MNRTSQRILVLGGILIGLVIIALLAVIAVLLVSGDDDGSSEAARVTATATGSPTPRSTPRTTPAATAPPSSHSPEPQQPASVATVVPEATPPPTEQQPASTAPPSAPPATTTPGETCPGPPAVASFVASPGTITAGDSSTLGWGVVTNATSVSVDRGIGAVEAPGSRVVTPATTTIYTLTVTGCGGTIERQATVIVNPPPPTPSPTPSPSPTPTPTEAPPPPGGGTWGITPIDLAVTGLNPDNLPQGEVWVTLANNGPYSLENAQVTLGCSGTAYLSGGGSVAIATVPWTIGVSLEVGWSAQYDTTISVDTNQYSSYYLQCSIEAVSYKDDVTDNNAISAWIP